MLERIDGLNVLKIAHQNNQSAIIMLHGYGADAYDLTILAELIPHDYDWYFPEGILNLPFGGKAWFPIDEEALNRAMQNHTHRDFTKLRPKGFDQAFQQLEKFVIRLSKKYSKIILGGFSQGSMLAVELSLLDINLDKLIILSGNLVDEKNLLIKLKSKPKFSFFQSHGKRDPLLGHHYANQLYQLLIDHGLKGEMVTFDGGHEIPPLVIKKLSDFLS